MFSYQDKQDSISKFFAADGLMNLGDYSLEHYPGAIRDTASNENGILFAVEFYFLLNHYHLLEEEDRKRFAQTMEDLTVKRNGIVYRGLYNRNPENNKSPEAHDNYIAIVAGAKLFNQFNIIKDICDYGSRTGWLYNNVNPEIQDINLIRQGADVAFFKMSSLEYSPTLWEFLWLFLAFVLECFTMNLKNTSPLLLSWLQLKSFELVDREKLGQIDKYLFYFLDLVKYYWIKKLLKITDGLGMEKIFQIYFKPEHPNVIFSKGVIF